MPTPLYCPACGTRLPEGDEFAKPTTVGTLRTEWLSFDVSCPACEWSGDIEPDEKIEDAKEDK